MLVGVLSFMTGDEITTGSIETDDDEKRRLAKVRQPRARRTRPGALRGSAS